MNVALRKESPTKNAVLKSLLAFLALATTAFALSAYFPGFTTQHVATNAELSAARSTDYPALVRDSITTAGDAPPLEFYASNTPCSLNSGAGDTGYQVPSADGKCWIAIYAGDADVREWGCVADGATDVGACINTALADAPTCVSIPATTNGFYIATTVANRGGCLKGTAFMPYNPYPSLSLAGISWLKCSATVNPCVALGVYDFLATNAPLIEKIALAGAGATPSSGSIGIQAIGGYKITLRDVFVYNFDTCAEWGPGANIAGISSHAYNLYLGRCQKHYTVFDGWPEAEIIGGRFGLIGTGDFSATDDFVYQTLTTNVGSGQGPNTIIINGVQMNPGGGVGCAFRWGGFTGSGGFPGETHLTDIHAEWHTYSGGATQGVFCSDSTVPAIYQLMVNGVLTVAPAPLFALNAATIPGQWFFANDDFGCASSTLALGNAASPAYSSLHFDNIFFCGATTFSGGTNSTLSVDGSHMGTLAISGAFGDAEFYGNKYNSLTDTATGRIAWGDAAVNSFTPVLSFSGGGSVSYNGTPFGQWERTANGGFKVFFSITLNGVSSPSGNVSVTGFPLQCSTGFGAQTLRFADNLSAVSGQPVGLFNGGASSIALAYWNSGSSQYSNLQGSALTSTTRLAGLIECNQAS